MPFVSAILLAAGESTRMGQQKALLRWEGTTLLEYQLTQLSAVEEIRQIIVVTGHDPDRITAIAAPTPGVIVVHNAGYRTGKVSSIKIGVTAGSPQTHAILLLAVDQPRSAAIHATLVRAHVALGGAITLPTNDGHRGHPIIFSTALRSELMTMSEATHGVRALLQHHAAEVTAIEVSDPQVNVDLNTPSDVKRSDSQSR